MLTVPIELIHTHRKKGNIVADNVCITACHRKSTVRPIYNFCLKDTKLTRVSSYDKNIQGVVRLHFR